MTRTEIEALLLSIDQKLTLLLVQKKKLPESRESLIAWAKGQPAYKGIDVERFYDKLAAWCDKKGKTLTANRFVRCLNKEDISLAPLPPTAAPPKVAPPPPPPQAERFTAPMPAAVRAELMEKGIIQKHPYPETTRNVPAQK